MLKRSISSTCHANVALHMPKYKYGVLTPGSCLPEAANSLDRADGRWATFHAVVSSVKSDPKIDLLHHESKLTRSACVPCMSAPYHAGFAIAQLRQYLLSSSLQNSGV